ncbi:HAD family hydrolase [Endothiovibrio diazotrophicus]
MTSRDYKLLIFDWDGTVMDSVSHIVHCIKLAAAEMGLEILPDERIKGIIGLGLTEAIDALYPGRGSAFHRELADRYRDHYLPPGPSPTPLFDGARETLETLRGAGYRLAVATGKGRSGLDRVLDETGLRPLFQATRTSDVTRSKPDPLMLHQILEELETGVSDALMIGDTEWDLVMAANAGMDALGVTYGVHDAERLVRHHPVGCIDAITELPAWLGCSGAAC